MADTLTYTYSSKFGSQGSGNGQFLDPHDLDFDSAGNLFVCDRQRNDIQKFTASGTYISKFGGPGSTDGLFNVPYSIGIDSSDNIYVADKENNRVQKFNSAGVYQSKITTINGQALNKPEDVQFDPTNGDIYIADTGNNRICKLTSAHAFILEWGSLGPGNGQFDHPHSVCVSSDRSVYVSCGNQPYIQKFTKTGGWIRKFGTEGTGPGQTQMFLEHMDIDIFNRVHLINNDSRPIVNVWDNVGNWICQYGMTSKGSQDGQFSEPEHVTCDSTGRPYVVDSGNFRIQIFSIGGSVTPPGTGNNPLAVDMKMYLTGGVANTDPNLSLGGNVSSTVVVSNNLHALFRRITESELSSGVTIYRCVALKNNNLTLTMRNLRFFMIQDTISTSDLALYSMAQAPKNTAETPIVNEFTAPTGSNILFKATLNRSGGLVLGDLLPGEYICVWLRLSVNPSATVKQDNRFMVRAEFDGIDNSGSGSGGGGGPTPDPNPDTGVNFSMITIADNSQSTFDKMVNSAKSKGVDFAVWNGDNAYKAGEKWFIDSVNGKGFGKAKSIVTFGNHDVDEGSDANGSVAALKNNWGLNKTYYSKIFNNVGMIVMEAGEQESVSSANGGTQYNAVKQMLIDLKANSAVEWIFVFNHYPIEGPPSAHHPNEDQVRDDFSPLFDTYGVDAVFNGHNHFLSRTKLIRMPYSGSTPTVVQAGPDFSYNRGTIPHGKVYYTSGGGGKGLYDMGSIPSWIPFAQKINGYLLLEFSSNGKKCTFKFYDSSDNLLDTTTITHL